MAAYYNEFDPYAAQWLRNLIDAGEIAPGDVDDRSIVDVRANDLVGYTQCHFFAGLGGWSLALRTANWPDDRPVWTGSCPCQPFSAAGKQKGTDDDRHLWPVWFNLVKKCRPRAIFGEQVASKAADEWLDILSNDLEKENYAVGAIDLPACYVGAPHLRQRRWFVGDADDPRLQGSRPERSDSGRGLTNGFSRPASRGHWDRAEYLPCIDGKSRPVEPGTFPLAHGVPGRVGRLRAYGNAIVPQVASEIISAYMEGI